VNVDDRSYRDIEMEMADGQRVNNPARTILGRAQFDWLTRVLLDAQRQGVTWKIVAISSPIDEVGLRGQPPRDTGKSWIGGYRAERNKLLKFIADNRIDHVVFLSTDDHQNRVYRLTYLADAADPTSRRLVPGAFTIVGGPIGAGGPDRFTEHGFDVAKTDAAQVTASAQAGGIEPIGLGAGFPGLTQVYREGDPAADQLRQPVDFYSPDTFNYVTLEISADGKSLAIDTWGINSYRANTFPEPSAAGAPRRVLGFRINID
jgi:alkaline phosphatase D